MTDRRENQEYGAEATAIREVIAKALWDHDEGLGWNMNVEAHADFLAKADAVLAALGEARLTVIDLGDPISPEGLRELVRAHRAVVEQVAADDCGCPETVCLGPLDDPMWCDREKANRG